MHVEQGFSEEESAVTVINVLSPHQVHSLTNKPLEVVQTRIAEAIADCGHGFGNFVVVLGPEHVAQLEGAGWAKDQVKAFLYEKARRPAEFYRRVGQLGDEETEDPVAALTGPEAVRIVVGGGMAGAFSAVIPTWALASPASPRPSPSAARPRFGLLVECGMTMPLTGVVLAGGKSRRLGRNKLVEPFEGAPLIARVIERLRPVCGEIVVVGAEPGAADALPLPDDARTAFDLYPDKGSLGGIYSGLAKATNRWSLVVAGDMPSSTPA